MTDSTWLHQAISIAKTVFYFCEVPAGRSMRSENCLDALGIQPAGSMDEWSALVHPADRTKFENAIKSLTRNEPRYEVEYRMLHGVTGALFWVLDRGEGEFEEAGQLHRLRGGAFEISGRVKAETAQRDAARKFGVSGDASRMGAWHLDVAANKMNYSDELLALLGFQRDQFDGTPEAFDKIIDPEDIPLWRSALGRELVPGSNVGIELRVSSAAGGVRWLLSRGEIKRGENGLALESDGVMIDITERKIAEEAADRLAAIVTSSEDAIISNNLKGIVTSWNYGAESLLGYRAEEMIGQPLTRIIPPDLATGPLASLRSNGPAETVGRYESMLLRKDQGVVDVSLTVSQIRNNNGRVAGSSIIARDITHRKNLEKRQAMMVRELSHRVKNTLAVVQAMSRQMLRSNANPKTFAEAFEGRIRSLASSHTLLTETDWGGASLTRMIHSQLHGIADDAAKRFSLHGSDVLLPAEVATQLGLVMHELATNAAKYGALSMPAGNIKIAWTISEGRLRVTWRERGGPRIVTLPKRKGFGTAFIDSSAAKVSHRYDPEGLTCKIELAL